MKKGILLFLSTLILLSLLTYLFGTPALIGALMVCVTIYVLFFLGIFGYGIYLLAPMSYAKEVLTLVGSSKRKRYTVLFVFCSVAALAISIQLFGGGVLAMLVVIWACIYLALFWGVFGTLVFYYTFAPPRLARVVHDAARKYVGVEL